MTTRRGVTKEVDLRAMRERIRTDGVLRANEANALISLVGSQREVIAHWHDSYIDIVRTYGAVLGKVRSVIGGLRSLSANTDPNATGSLCGAYTAIARDISIAVEGRDLAHDKQPK